MKVKSIQKTTVIDYPGKIACTLFLFGCSFRCGFCHNPELVTKETSKDISKEEVLDFLKKRQNQLEGVCFTGGEPLMTLEKEFVKEIKDLGYSIKIDTNGSFPERLKELIDENLVDFVSMDIKTNKEEYSDIARVPINIENIEKSIRLIMENLEEYEFRTTILKKLHSKEKVIQISQWLSGLNSGKKVKKYALQGFKNSGKLIDNSFSKYFDTSETYLNELKEEIKDNFEVVEVRY